MRVKNFHGSSINEVMRQVRDALGDEAVIISTTRLPDGKGVQVTAALEEEEVLAETAETSPGLAEMGIATPPPRPVMEEQPKAKAKATTTEARHESIRLDALRAIVKVLHYHNCPNYLLRQLMHQAELCSTDDPGRLVVATLTQSFDFSPVQLLPGEAPIMLIGAPGVGKTMTAAKMLTQAAMQQRKVAAITTDSHKAAGIEQLQAFTNILGIPLRVAESPKELKALLKELWPAHAVIIDTPGCNPYDSEELKGLGQFIACYDLEPVLVCHAGLDGLDAADIASNFAYLGASRMIVTKIDTARRYGGVLTAAHAGNFAFSHFSRHAGALEGFEEVSPERLAKMLLHHNVTTRG